MLGKYPTIKLILLDIEMPIIDGIEFFFKSKDAKIINHIPVIMVTAVTNKKKVVEMIKKGVVAYILKPYNENEFLRIVRNVLNSLKKNKRML